MRQDSCFSVNIVDFICLLQDEDDPLKTHVDEELLSETKKNGVWADHVVMQAMSRLLQRDIWVVTSQKSRTEKGALIEKMESGCQGDPMLLGHLGEFHYWSLGKYCLCLYICNDKFNTTV